MLEAIEKLLILQERDRKILQVKNELSRVSPEREMLQAKLSNSQRGLDAARQKANQLESERKRLELDVESKKQQIAKYSLQQFQTKKNEEYRALAQEIDTCNRQIRKLEDQQLDLMEQLEIAQKETAIATQTANESKKLVDGQTAELGKREAVLTEELAALETNRNELAQAVEENARNRYERLLRNKGATVVVGIQHGVCGGCQMRFPVLIILQCKREEELVTCPNCARILYYSPEMDLAVAE
jgi:predicted  nucleic acid-binding Zn-ribbon protein